MASDSVLLDESIHYYFLTHLGQRYWLSIFIR